LKKSIKYKDIEEIKYEFTEYEIQEALMEKYKIKRYKNSKIMFELFEGDEDNRAGAELIMSTASDKD